MSAMKQKVVVSDRMQRGYVYWRTEPVGRNFAPAFAPQLTPKEMLRLGVFGGKYAGDNNDRLRCTGRTTPERYRKRSPCVFSSWVLPDSLAGR